MSHSIVYDRAFIKASNGIIPLLLAEGNLRRLQVNGDMSSRRAWCTLFGQDVQFAPGDELLGRITGLMPPNGFDYFKYRGKMHDAVDVIQFYRKGIEEAATIEEWRIANPGEHLRCCVNLFDSATGFLPRELILKYIKSTEELDKWMTEAMTLVDEYKDSAFLSVSFFKETVLRKPSLIDGPVVARDPDRREPMYLCKFIKDKSITFNADLSKAIVFESAEAAVATLGERFKYRLVSAKKLSELKKKKQWIISLQSTNVNGRFVKKRTKNHLFVTTDEGSALSFCSVKEAQAYFDGKVFGRFPEIYGCDITRKNDR